MNNAVKLIVGITLMLIALAGLASLASCQSPLYTGPGTVGRMAVWEVASLAWKPWTLLGYGLTANLYTGPGTVARLAYWNGTAWQEWDGHVPIGWLTAGNWKVFYSNGTGAVQQLALPAAYHYFQGNGVAAAPSWVNVLQPTRIKTTAGPDTFYIVRVVGNLMSGDSSATGFPASSVMLNSISSVLLGGAIDTMVNVKYGGIVAGYNCRMFPDPAAPTSYGSGIFGGWGCRNDGWVGSVTVGGCWNYIDSTCGTSVIAGGDQDSMLSDGSTNDDMFMGGGVLNKMDHSHTAAIVAGAHNYLYYAPYSFIAGGDYDTIYQGRYATILGGINNKITLAGFYSHIGGGHSNRVSNLMGAILNGRQNYALGDSFNVVIGGFRDSIGAGRFNIIGGGSLNYISGTGATGSHNVIGGGSTNYIVGTTGSNYSVIAGGFLNNISYGGNTEANVVGGGRGNTNTSVGYSTIAGGYGNKVNFGYYQSIGGGYMNYGNGSAATIAGGDGDTALASYAAIGGGHRSHVSVTGAWGTVGGGEFNRVNAPYSTIPGGDSNAVAVGCSASVAMGKLATAAHPRSIIFGGTGTAFSTTASGQAMFAMPNGLTCMDSSRLNALGGVDVKMYNGSQDVLYRGQIVKSLTSAGNGYKWVVKVAVDDIHPIGTVQEASIATNTWGWITVSGAGYVAVIDGRTQTVINGDRLLAVCAAADVGAAAGLANCYTTAGVPVHDREVGHPISDKNIGVNTSATTDSICVAMIHFR